MKQGIPGASSAAVGWMHVWRPQIGAFGGGIRNICSAFRHMRPLVPTETKPLARAQAPPVLRWVQMQGAAPRRAQPPRGGARGVPSWPAALDGSWRRREVVQAGAEMRSTRRRLDQARAHRVKCQVGQRFEPLQPAPHLRPSFPPDRAFVGFGVTANSPRSCPCGSSMLESKGGCAAPLRCKGEVGEAPKLAPRYPLASWGMPNAAHGVGSVAPCSHPGCPGQTV